MDTTIYPKVKITLPSEFIVKKGDTFTVSIEANDFAGTLVKEFIGTTNPYGIDKIEYYEITDDTWKEMTINSFFGLESGFLLSDSSTEFRASFNAIGQLPLVVKLLSIDEKTVLVEEEVKINVVESEIEEGTKYMEIYEQFLSAVTDDRFAQMSEEELMIDLLPLLKRAIYYLCRIAKVPGFDLHNRDDINYIFMEKLTDHEIECLAWAMVVSWVEQQLNSTRLIEQQYYDAGIKTYSPNETMRNLLTLHDDYYKKLKNRLTSYTYKTVDISQFGGNE